MQRFIEMSSYLDPLSSFQTLCHGCFSLAEPEQLVPVPYTGHSLSSYHVYDPPTPKSKSSKQMIIPRTELQVDLLR